MFAKGCQVRAAYELKTVPAKALQPYRVYVSRYVHAIRCL